ncbi:MAG: (2Fe-2S)-binding protein [Acidobacteria bacterium]|nr:(2Fe-2S)-binding protein [Acidobacteriota bacterium]
MTLQRLNNVAHRFCPDSSCAVVYFDAEGASYVKEDLRVPVWQKEPFGDRTVCSCFGVSEETIRAEIQTTGRSEATDRVRAHIAAGRCACEVRNPRGVCCLGDVAAAVKRVEVALQRPAAITRS